MAIWSSLFSGLGNLGKLVGIETLAEAGSDELRAILRQAGGMTTEGIKKMLQNNSRIDLLRVMIRLDPDKFKNMWDLYKDNVESFWENEFVANLGEGLVRDGGKLDVEESKKVYEFFTSLSPEDQAVMLELLKHDPIMGKLRHLLDKGKDFWVSLHELDGYFEAAAADMEEDVQRLKRKADRKKWFWNVW